GAPPRYRGPMVQPARQLTAPLTASHIESIATIHTKVVRRRRRRTRGDPNVRNRANGTASKPSHIYGLVPKKPNPESIERSLNGSQVGATTPNKPCWCTA